MAETKCDICGYTEDLDDFVEEDGIVYCLGCARTYNIDY